MSLRWIDTSLSDRIRADAQQDMANAQQSDARRRAERELIAADRRSGYGRRHADSNQ